MLRAACCPFEHDGALSAVARQGSSAEELLPSLLVLAVLAQQIGDDRSEKVMVFRRREMAQRLDNGESFGGPESETDGDRSIEFDHG